jgi:tartrate dehydratase beta subunit/fumarate hydratase class I family protein
MFSDLCKSVLKVGDEVLIPGVVFTGRNAAGLASHPQ